MVTLRRFLRIRASMGGKFIKCFLCWFLVVSRRATSIRSRAHRIPFYRYAAKILSTKGCHNGKSPINNISFATARMRKEWRWQTVLEYFLRYKQLLIVAQLESTNSTSAD